MGSSISAGVGVKANINSNIQSSINQGSQVLRKSIIQTTFKELYDYEKNKLVVHLILDNTSLPKITCVEEIEILGQSISSSWVINPERLNRGDLIEMEVELETEPIFQISTVVSALLELFEEDPQMFGLDPNGDILQIKSVNSILAKLLVGLIPVRGYLFNYRVIEINGKEWILHKKILERLSEEDLDKRKLYIVGVAEQSLFWKDIRRVLFSNARFNVMCRVAKDGVQNFWRPVKLADVLSTVVPDIGEQIDNMGAGVLNAMANASSTNQNQELKKRLIYKSLIVYAKLLAEYYKFDLSEKDLNQIKNLAKKNYKHFNSIKERRASFNIILKYLTDRFKFEKDPLVVAQYRTVALLDAGLNYSGEPLSVKENYITPNKSNDSERFLDTEFIAIYW